MACLTFLKHEVRISRPGLLYPVYDRCGLFLTRRSSNYSLHGCLCGYATDPQHECTCTPQQIQRYRAKISGPLLDRIDIQIEVPAVKYKELSQQFTSEDSAVIRT